MAASNPSFADPRFAFAPTMVAMEEATPKPRPAIAIPREKASTTTVSTRARVRRSSSWWGLLLCGLVAGFFTGAAIFASPLGEHPALQRFTVAVASLTTGR
jgi:hypothetical protein